MPALAPDFAVPVHRRVRVHAIIGDESIEGELLAIGWDVAAQRAVGEWPRDGVSYLVLDRRTCRPHWVLETDVESIRERGPWSAG